ncbi:MAG: oxidoreductase [Saprospiraceae bacterium]|nr:MAG: oxidoreductase [Saprospiraceae bacterium]
MNFKDKVIWITGASSGIGEYLAYAFAQRGAKLIISSRNQQELERVQQHCAPGTEVLILPLDVSKFDLIPEIAQRAISHFGRLDLLINNAGISQRALIKETDFSVDKKIMEVNYLGSIAVTKAVLPTLLAQQSGHIVTISSVMGKFGAPWRSAYAASKHALQAWFDSLRAEVHQDNIKVTIICPGYVRTNVTINALKGDGSKNNKMAAQTEKGLDPAVFAEKAIRAIAAEKEEVLIGGKEIIAVYFKRFFPGIFSYFVKKISLS